MRVMKEAVAFDKAHLRESFAEITDRYSCLNRRTGGSPAGISAPFSCSKPEWLTNPYVFHHDHKARQFGLPHA
jgi:hypothetical protein